MSRVIAQCMITVPSQLGGYALFGLTPEQLIAVAVDHINRGDDAFVSHPEYDRSGCAFSDTILDLAVEIIGQLPAEFESDYDRLTILYNSGAAVLLSLEFTDATDTESNH